MFENGSLLRRRKRFKLHKPDKELLKSELQALASAMPPPLPPPPPPPPPSHSESSTVVDTSPACHGNGLSLANLHRLRDDLLRWEMQERRMMAVSASSNPAEFPGTGGFGRFDTAVGLTTAAAAPAVSVATEAVAGYYLLSPEVRQRLAGTDGTNEILRTYEAAALLHSASWNFSGFPVSSSYVSQLPYLHQTSRQTLSTTRETTRDERRLPNDRALENGTAVIASGRENDVFIGESAYEIGYRDKFTEEDPLSSSSSSSSSSRLNLYRSIVTTSPPTSPTSPNSPASKSYRHLSPISNLVMEVERTLPNREDTTATVVLTGNTTIPSIEKRAKKPFTIENIIAPDDNNEIGSGDSNGGGRRGGAGAGVADTDVSVGDGSDETASRLSHESLVKKSSLLVAVPRPLYAGYSMSVATAAVQRPSYGTAT